MHTGPRVQRASGIPCSLVLRDNDTQASGASRRENADVYLLFDIRIKFLPRHCEPTGRANARPMTGSAKQSIVRLVLKLDCFVAALLAMTADG
jgi:hypothetical protein